MTHRHAPVGMKALLAYVESTPRAFSRAELTARWSAHTLQRALDRGLLLRMAPGVYAAAAHSRTDQVIVGSAMRWAGPAGALTGVAGLRQWQIDVSWNGLADVLLPRRLTRPPPPLVRVRRTDIPDPTRHLNKIRTVVPEVALLHAWAVAPARDRTALLLDVLRASRLDAATVRGALAMAPRLRARNDLLRVLATAELGVTSYLEYIAHTEVFTGGRWTECEWQARIRVATRTLTVDMFHRASRVVVEFDGRRYHSDDRARRRDLERDALLAATGYTTIRLTYEDVTRRPAWCVAMVRNAIDQRLGGR